jgi:hypothetical protein
MRRSTPGYSRSIRRQSRNSLKDSIVRRRPYEDVKNLVESGILECVTDTQPHRYRTRQIDLNIQIDEHSYQITPALFVALARHETNENIQLFLDRHGVSGLATALEYARDYA